MPIDQGNPAYDQAKADAAQQVTQQQAINAQYQRLAEALLGRGEGSVTAGQPNGDQ